MGDQHQRAGKALQVALQPLDAVGVEVVGGLIEQQHIRLGHQRRRQGQALAIPAGEIADAPPHIADPQPVKHLADLLLQAPGLALVHAGVERAQLSKQGRLIGRVSAHLPAFALLGMGLGQGLRELGVTAQQDPPCSPRRTSRRRGSDAAPS